MLDECFYIFDGISCELEDELKSSGIKTWNDFISKESIPGLEAALKKKIDGEMNRFLKEIEEEDYLFCANLPPKEHWRLYPLLERKKRVCYLDIETTGLNFFKDEVTLVGIYDGEEYRHLTLGVDLTEENIIKALEPYDMFVTHYGLKFDIPFLKYQFPELNTIRLQFDLSFSARKMKLGDNLHEVEENLKIGRGPEVHVISGFEVTQLWEDFQKGNEEALNMIVEHNSYDVINLKKIAHEIFNRLKAQQTK